MSEEKKKDQVTVEVKALDSRHQSVATSDASSSSTPSLSKELDSEDSDNAAPPPPANPPLQRVVSAGDEIYDRLSPRRKVIIVTLTSICGLLALMSSSAVLAAVPEVAEEYGTNGSIINVSNALYMGFMGLSPCFWGPMSQVYGRRWISLITTALFSACSLGTALAPNLAAFFVFRILTAFEGTAFLIVGAACISDVYRPTERGTAMGWFLSGALIGPSIGPFIGGVIVNFVSWRAIFYLQTAIAASLCIAAFFLQPETTHYAKKVELVGLPVGKKIATLASMTNPWRVIKLLSYPNLFIAYLGSSALFWNMYGLLTPIRYVLNPRFALTSPIKSALFYLAPGPGYVIGTIIGGKYADHIVKKHIARRGARVAEDRLRSTIPHMLISLPGSMLIYGWTIDREVGGIAVPVIMMFLQGFLQMWCQPALNTYCLDAMKGRGAEVIAGNYLLRYMFAALATAVVLPAIEKIGVGWFSTISALFLVISALLIWVNVLWGKGWREGIEAKKKERKELRESRKGKGSVGAGAGADLGGKIVEKV